MPVRYDKIGDCRKRLRTNFLPTAAEHGSRGSESAPFFQTFPWVLSPAEPADERKLPNEPNFHISQGSSIT